MVFANLLEPGTLPDNCDETIAPRFAKKQNRTNKTPEKSTQKQPQPSSLQ